MKFTRAFVLNLMVFPAKLFAIATLSALFGYLTTFASTLAFDAPAGAWYESPAFTAAIAAGMFVIGAKVVDGWLENRKKKTQQKDQQKADDEANDFNLQHLTGEQWNDVLNRRDMLHKEQIEFLRSQHMSVEVTKYELRERNHRAMNEVTALQVYCAKLRETLVRAGVEIPDADYQMKSYFQIMDGVDDKVEAYAEKLRLQYSQDGKVKI